MSITIDMPKSIECILDLRCRDEHVDKISIIKEMLWDGAESYLVDQYSIGKISKGKLAELLNRDLYEVGELLEKYHIKSSLSYEQFTRGIKTAEESSRYEI